MSINLLVYIYVHVYTCECIFIYLLYFCIYICFYVDICKHLYIRKCIQVYIDNTTVLGHVLNGSHLLAHELWGLLARNGISMDIDYIASEGNLADEPSRLDTFLNSPEYVTKLPLCQYPEPI